MKKVFWFIFLTYLILSCENPTDNNNNTSKIKTGRLTFLNESSYRAKVHRDSFSGIIVVELSSYEDKTLNVRVSDDRRYGTTFSIEYLYRINNEDDFDPDSGEIIASGLDYNVQINQVIEEGMAYTIKIPQPSNLDFRTAFIKLTNANNLPIELKYYGRTFPLNNGNLTTAAYKTGVYKLEGIPAGGGLLEGYHVVATFESTPVPVITTKNGNIESFKYDGNSVTHTGTKTFIFK